MSDILNKVISHCKSLGMIVDDQGYVTDPKENLLTTVNNWVDIEVDLSSGMGGELVPDKNGRLKFNAVHSSSALCINTFSVFKENKTKFDFFGNSGFQDATFEKQLPTGISKPNLDFYLESPNSLIGFESKFLEILNDKLPNHNLQKYLDRKTELGHLPSGFDDLILNFIEQNEKMYLDISQLIKHTLGILNKYNKYKSDNHLVEPILVYIYWLPVNWFNIPLYQQHQREVDVFRPLIEQFIRFIPISYLDFWKMYEAVPLFQNHIKTVKERYLISI